MSESYGKLPLHFEANQGQTHRDVRFLSRGSGYSLYLTASEAVLVLAKPNPDGKLDSHGAQARPEAKPQTHATPVALRMALIGANRKPLVSGLEELPGKANYFIGNDPAQWRTDVSTYAKVHYREVYPGIDLVYYGNQRQLEYDFVVAPGADPKKIVLSFQGADKLEVDAQGELVLQAAGGAIHQKKPVIYQEVDGVRTEIAGRYVLKDSGRVGFEVAAYDRSLPLVIDPILYYSTFLGGNQDDRSGGIAVDAAGNAYVVGITQWTYNGGGDTTNFTNNFPTTPGAFHTNTAKTSTDIFVTKLDPTGSTLVYSTYLGGSGHDYSGSIAVDADGNAYVTGAAGYGFPTTTGAFQTTGAGAFVTKVNSTGSALVYSTIIGNDGWVSGIALDADGNAYVTGRAGYDFPTTPGAFQTTGAGAFVTKVNSTGSALVYSTYISGGAEDSTARGIAVDAQGHAYVTGDTRSKNLPTTPGAFQSSYNEGVCPNNPSYTGTYSEGPCPDAFVTKLNPAGSALVYSTYLGGSLSDVSAGIAVDALGHAYVTGTTNSSDFPTTAGAFQPSINDQATCYVYYAGWRYSVPCHYSDAFVTRLNPAGSALVYSTYLGGPDPDASYGIALDAAGNAYVIALGSVKKLDPTGSALLYSLTELNGAPAWFSVAAIALDTSDNLYLTGWTGSRDFRTTMGAYQSSHGGYPWWSNDDRSSAIHPDPYYWGDDAFVAKIAFATTRFEQETATYRGPWTTYGPDTGSFSNGTAVASEVAGSTATFTFTGTAVTWFSARCVVCGIAAVSIDGGPATDVNTGTYSSRPLAPEVVFAASGLAANVSHTITITVAGRTTSNGNRVIIDAIEVAPPSDSPTTRSEESAATYTGTWTSYGAETGTFSGGTVLASNAMNTASFSFTGSAVTWIGVKCNVCGIAAVSIDGGAATTVNTGGPGVPGSLTSEPVFSASGLAPDMSHTMTITVAGTTTSGGTYIAMDGFDVTR